MSKSYKIKIEGDIRKGGLLRIDSFNKNQINATSIDVDVSKIRIGPKWKSKPEKEK